MAKKQPAKVDAVFLGYVRTQVDEVAKKWVAANLLKDEQIGSSLIKWSGEGLKVSVQYREQEQCYLVGLYCSDRSDGNAGLMLTTRHADVNKAITLMRYLHEVKYDGVWPPYQDSRQDVDW